MHMHYTTSLLARILVYMYAVYLGHLETTKRLLSLAVNVEQRNPAGQNALILAVSCGAEKDIPQVSERVDDDDDRLQT